MAANWPGEMVVRMRDVLALWCVTLLFLLYIDDDDDDYHYDYDFLTTFLQFP